MSKIMVAKSPEAPVSVIHHGDKVYRPNKKGLFDIDDGHVEAMRPHGLVLLEELEKAAKAKATADLAAENDALKARVAELEAAAKPAK